MANTKGSLSNTAENSIQTVLVDSSDIYNGLQKRVVVYQTAQKKKKKRVGKNEGQKKTIPTIVPGLDMLGIKYMRAYYLKIF